MIFIITANPTHSTLYSTDIADSYQNGGRATISILFDESNLLDETSGFYTSQRTIYEISVTW